VKFPEPKEEAIISEIKKEHIRIYK